MNCLRALHGRQGWLCDRLEQFADHLPETQSEERLEAAWALTTVVLPLHAIEEDCFFPLLKKRLPKSLQLAASIDRSLEEHLEDRDATVELIASIKQLTAGCERKEIDMISYQLRAFFVGLRRHEAREREVFFPAALASFTAADRRVLQAGLDQKFGH